MRTGRLILAFGAACSALGVAGCAGTTAEEERREAQVHQYRAQRAAAIGDYERAAAEQRAARRASREAYDKQREEEERVVPPPSLPPALPPGY
jgi:hypothetical protein